MDSPTDRPPEAPASIPASIPADVPEDVSSDLTATGEHPTESVVAQIPLAQPPLAIGSMPVASGTTGVAARGAGSRRRLLPRVLIAVSTALLLVVLLVSVVAAVSANTPIHLSDGTPSPVVAESGGTPDPHALDWTGMLHSAATTTYINDLIAHMSLDEEIGQMLIVDFDGTDVSPALATKIQQYHVGGAILYARNYYSAASLHQLTTHMQADAAIPLFIAVDQEGGTVDRMAVIDGPRPSAETMGNRNDPAYVRQIGADDGRSMYGMGVNVNLAPVVDVQNVPDSATYMAWRMFGWTPDKVTTMAGAYLDGLESQHVIGTLKHFPGLGAIGGNPHQVSVIQTRDLAALDSIDWAPYHTLLASGEVGLIMTTHVTLEAVDSSRPTTVSYPVTTGVLRQKLGYQGVIITDDIYMDSLMAWSYPLADRVIGAVQAGNDLIASLYTLDATTHAEQVLHDAVVNGTISKARIDESVRRILLLKLQYGILKMPAA